MTMRYKGFIAMLAVALMLTTTVASAQQEKSKKSKSTRQYSQHQNSTKVSTEFGLGVGARYNFFSVYPISENFTPNITMQFSGGAALQFRLNIGRSFGFQPEISYARSSLRINDEVNNFSTKVKSNIVQIPMLLSFRAAMFRFNFGPVFTLMDNATYSLADKDETIKQMQLGRLYPTVTYAAGISVKFAKIMMIDVRYGDQFWFKKAGSIKSENQYLWTLDQDKQPTAQSFRTRTQSVQLRFGVVF